MVDKEFVLQKAKYESGIEKDITVGDVIRKDRIGFRSGHSGAFIAYMVSDDETSIIRKVVNYETVSGEPSVSYKEVYKLR